MTINPQKSKMWLPYLATWLSEIWHSLFTLGIIVMYLAFVVKFLAVIYHVDNDVIMELLK